MRKQRAKYERSASRFSPARRRKNIARSERAERNRWREP
jgi:hypothetical protein